MTEGDKERKMTKTVKNKKNFILFDWQKMAENLPSWVIKDGWSK